jgi:hypothetical protein
MALLVPSYHFWESRRELIWNYQTVSLGTWVNKAGQASSEALSDYTRGCRRHLRLHCFLLLAMLARQVLRTVHNYHHDRHHPPQP